MGLVLVVVVVVVREEEKKRRREEERGDLLLAQLFTVRRLFTVLVRSSRRKDELD